MQAAVSIPAASTAEAPTGHDQAMAARTEAGATAAAAGLSQVPPAPAPAGAPAEAPVAPPAGAPATPPAEAPAAAPAVAEDGILTRAGLTRDGLAAEYAEGGDISEASYAKLAEQGISKEDFQQYLAGRQATADAYQSSVIKETVGTPEKYQEVVEWAAKSLKPEEITAFNEMVNSGDPVKAALAVQGLASRHATANPAEPNLLTTGTPAAGVQGYDSWAQVTADMRDPQYAKDPAFRDRVRDKLAASPKDLKRA